MSMMHDMMIFEILMFSDAFRYKVCVIWISESAILKHLRNRQGTKTDNNSFAKRGFNPALARI
jgi:hypothetical protein